MFEILGRDSRTIVLKHTIHTESGLRPIPNRIVAFIAPLADSLLRICSSKSRNSPEHQVDSWVGHNRRDRRIGQKIHGDVALA